MKRKGKHPHLRDVLSISQSFNNQISQNVIEQIFKECNGDIDRTISILSSTTDSWNSTSNVINDSYKYICQRLQRNDIDEDICKEILISNSFDIEKSLFDIQRIFNFTSVAASSDYKNKSTKQHTLTTTNNNNNSTTTDAALLDQLAQKLIDDGYFLDYNLFPLSDTVVNGPNNKEGKGGIIMTGEASGVPTEDQLYMQSFFHELFDDFIASEDSSVNDSSVYDSSNNDTTCDSISPPPIESGHNSDPPNSDPLIWSDMIDTRTTQEVALDYIRELFAHTEYSDSLLSEILVTHAYDVDAAVSTLCQINDTGTSPSTCVQSAEEGKYTLTSISFADAVKAPSHTPSTLVKYAQDPYMKHNKKSKNLIKKHILSKFTLTDTTASSTPYPTSTSYTPLFQHTTTSSSITEAYTQTPPITATTATSSVRKSTSLPSLTDLSRTNKSNNTSSATTTTTSSSSAKTRAPPVGEISQQSTAIDTDTNTSSWQEVRYKEAIRLVSTFQRAGQAIDSGTQQGRCSIGYSIAGHLLSEGKRAKARYISHSFMLRILYQ